MKQNYLGEECLIVRIRNTDIITDGSADAKHNLLRHGHHHAEAEGSTDTDGSTDSDGSAVARTRNIVPLGTDIITR